MTDLASLAIRIDASEVNPAAAGLDKLTASGAKAQGAVDGLGKISSQAGKQISTATEQAAAMAGAALSTATAVNGAGKEWVRASSAAGQLRMAEASATMEADRLAKAAMGAGTAATRMAHNVVVSAGQQRAGMQQLSYQIGDVAQQFALGTNPMIIFAQQGGQVIQALNMMKGGAGGLIGFLGGPWGAVITGAVMILGTLGSKLFEAGAAAKDMATQQSDLAKFVDFTTGKIRQQISAVVALAEAQRQAQKAQDAADAYKKNRQALIDAGTLGGGGTAGFALGTDLSAVTTQMGKARGELKQLTEQYQAGAINVNQLGTALKRLAASEPSIRAQINTMIRLGGAVSQNADSNRQYVAGLHVLTGTATDADRAFLRLQETTATHTKSVNSQIEALARYEAANDRVSKAQARVQMMEQQAPEFSDAKSAAAIKYQHDLAAAYREVEVAQRAASDEKKSDAAARSAENKAEAAARAAQHHAEQLAREAAAMDVNAKAGLALASAYFEVEGAENGVTIAAGAAIIAEARRKAVTDATRKGLDEEAQTRRQLAIMLADGAVQAGKSISQLHAEAAARAGLNDQVEAGTVSAGEMAGKLKDQLALLPLLQMKEAARAMGLKDFYEFFKRAIEQTTAAQEEANATEAKSLSLASLQQGKDQIAILQKEYELIGATNEERAVALAMLQKEQQLRGSHISPEDKTKQVDQAGEIARQTERNNVAQEVNNKLLSEQLDILDTLDQRAHTLADSLSDAFGAPGEALGKLLTDFTGYAAQREQLQEKLNAQILAAGKNEEAVALARAEYARNSGAAELQHYGNILSAAKGFFKEGTAGYKVMTTLEKVYSALQLANMIKSIVMDKVVTANSVGNSAVRGAADAAAGAAKIFASLGPLGFPVVAAMVGVLAALGLKGLSGGGKGPSIPTAEDVQKSQGTGTVLGDSSAKSDSISKALDLVEKHTNKDLEYSSDMLRALRSIDSQMNSFASAVARQMAVPGGSFDTSGLGLGSKSGVPLLGLPLTIGPIDAVLKHIPVIGGVIDGILTTLFGTKKTVTLLDQGFEFAAQSVGQIVSSGVVGDIYNALQTTKKSKFFGISTGTKTSTSTQTSALDSGFTDQINLLIGSLRDGIVGAAKVIGVDGAEAMIDSFQLDLGKISLKDLKGDDLTNAIEAVFSKAADDMAGAVAPGLSEFQKVGEGLFETLTRLARDYQVVDVSLASIGKTFGAVGLASVGMRENLIDLFGGLDNFTDLTGQFAQNFLTEAEQMAPVQAAVAKAMADLGLAGIATKDQFKQTVMGLDLTTEAGQSMYAQLLSIAPAFAKVQDYLVKLNPALEDTAKTVQQLAEIEKQRRTLEIALMDAQGDSAGALAAKRADDLAAMDESNRALQQQVWSAQDAAQAQKDLAAVQAEAARQVEAIAAKRRDLEIQLMEATGNAAGALAARRDDELAAMDDSLKALQLQVYAAQDAAAANEALANVQMTAAEIAKTRRDLEIQLMDAQGNAAGALAARRQDELAALDPVLRALQNEVWAAQDAAEANQALADVLKTAADVIKERHSLEIRLMEAQGNAAGVLAAQRADELAATDASNRALLQLIYNTEDAAAADAALSAVHQTAAEIAKNRHDLEIRLMQAQGDSAGVLAAQRADELAATDESNRALLQLIYATEDATAADAALNGVRQTAAEIAKTQHDLELRLMEAQGDAAGALARRRQDEIAATDASLRPLLELIYATEDATAADAALNGVRQTAAEISKAQHDLELRLMEATGDTAGALARRRADEVASMDASLRPMLDQIYAAEDAATAADALAKAQEAAAQAAADAAAKIAEIAQARHDLEIRLMEAEGNAAGALAAKRADELAAADESNRALLEQIYAAEDAAKAADALAQAQADQAQAAQDAAAKIAAIAQERHGLEIRLMEALGDATGALAAKRADEVAAADESNRALLQQIYTAEDAATANQALADAQSAAAQAAEQAAQQAAELAKVRSGLEIDLMRALGNEAGALAAERALALAGTDDSLKALQQQVWAAQDAAAAQQALADAQAASARAAEEAAQAQQALADKRTDLEIRLLRATGHEIDAVAVERERELNQLDPSLRSLQRQVYAAEDAKAAIDDHNKSIADTVSKYRGLADGLREYKTSLAGAAALTSEEIYRAAAAQFGAVSAKARTGDTDALGALGSAGDRFLSAARENASSALEYKRSVGFVASAVESAIRVAEGKASEAEQQLALGGQQLDMLTTINGTLMSVHDAIIDAADRSAPIPTTPSYAPANPSNDNAELLAEIKAFRADMVPPTVATAVAVKRMDSRTEAQDDGGYQRVSTDGQALEVDVA